MPPAIPPPPALHVRPCAQVNGKVRGKLEVGVAAEQADAVEAALGLPNVCKYTDGKELKKVIYVPGKILNLIVPGK